MADDSYRKEYPQSSRPEDNQSRPPPSQYPPPPQDNAQRAAEAPPSSMAASVTLPSIHGGYSYNQGRGYPHDPRYPSPGAVNGYPSPGQQQHPPPPQQAQQPPPQQQQQPPYLPPLQPQSDPRSPYPPPQEHRGYYDDRRPYPPHDPYAGDAYYAYRGQPPQGPPPPGGVYRDYRPNYPPGVFDYPPVGPPGAAQPLTQAAPRQRTSIACRYCRKRKIRCSGYQSAPGGKCQNCARMNQECIFQPVSSSSSTAFIPVSAVPGGVPPGTQLFGAYGQPLAPGTVPPHPGAPPPHAQAPPHGAPPHVGPPYQQHPTSAPPIPPPGYYGAPVQSPTGSFSSYGDPPRPDDGQVTGRRRRRTSEEQEEGYRLPPPRPSNDDDLRRRSPAEFSNNSSSGGLPYNPYPGAKQSPVNTSVNALPPSGGNYATRAPASRSPPGQNGSSGTSTPARNQQPQKGNSSVMSLSNLVTDIDKGMIERLNRPVDRLAIHTDQSPQAQKKDGKSSQNGSS